MIYLIFAPVVLAIIYTAYLALWLKRQPAGNEKMREISKAIQEGSSAYLNRQYKAVGVVAAILFIIIGFALNWLTALGFLIGAFASALAGYIGMNISVRANVRTTEAAKEGIDAALALAFRGDDAALVDAALAYCFESDEAYHHAVSHGTLDLETE